MSTEKEFQAPCHDKEKGENSTVMDKYSEKTDKSLAAAERAVAGGFTVPIFIYALDTDRGDNSTLSIDLDLDNCPVSNTNIQVCLRSYT